MNPRALIRRHPLPFQALAGETIVVQPETRQVHVLSGSGASIWELLAEERSLAELCARLEHDWDAPSGVVAEEVARFVAELVGMRLLSVSPAEARP